MLNWPGQTSSLNLLASSFGAKVSRAHRRDSHGHAYQDQNPATKSF